MDRELPQKELQQARNQRLLRIAVLLVAASLALLLLRHWISPGVARADLRTSVVERGDVRATISASGVVVPRDEVVISASFQSEVREVLAEAGTSVNEGDPILLLDARPLEVEIQDLEERLALKENERISARLRLEQATNDARGNYELRKIDLESRETTYNRLSQLAENGIISKGELQEAELDVRRTTVELEQLQKQMQNQREANQAELDKITLETAILQNQLDERRRLLDLTTVRAPRTGVLTWVLDETGTSIIQGMALARVADLSAYRVEATLSDFYAPRLSEGLPADIDIGSGVVAGRVQSILPTVENGAMQLVLALEEPAASGLRPQLRVEVDIVTGLASNTLLVRRGLSIEGSGRQELYRIVDGVAHKVAVQLGIGNREHVQVIDGLSEGDVVINSDVSEFEHLDQVKVK